MKTSEACLKFFADYIQRELGIVYRDANFYQLETRLVEVSKLLGIAGPEELMQQAQRGLSASAKGILLDIATNNETSFFRDPALFESLDTILNDLIERHKGRTVPLRVWSAACSYGQEVYSIAMTLDQKKSSLPAAGFQLLASDISDRALNAAKAGIYSTLQVQRGLTPAHLERHFQRTDEASKEEWQVRPELKRNLTFKKMNLLEPFGPIGPFDLIFCRNVLIYQTVEKKSEILSRIFEKLEPGGYLVLGAAESLLGVSDLFEHVRLPKATVFRRTDKLSRTA